MARRALRPVDLAREHGLSTQAVRNYEDEGILPPAERGDTGYRRYSAVHAQALRAFLALRPGYGHRTAVEIMRAAHHRDDETLFRLIDRAHVELLRERETLGEVAAALGALTAEPGPGGNPSGRPATEPASSGGPSGGLTIGALAHQLGMHPASLRKWERAGILQPHRDRATGYRVYPPGAVRDARMARQLRRGGYPLARIRLFVEQLRAAGSTVDLADLLREWRTRLGRRSRAMLAAGRELDDYLALLDSGPARAPSGFPPET
ncbi:MerR family transcriptional regulator [Streptosporangium pseudovulgare]|uniref:MerR family transcriptional regulator n=1 Tax=Streptosporangium pseudovulgare TaxID=35765 RepID=A0ABQ2R0M5_9ACTN|nr:MerR family transcriptional regulator [Streptosporangium pseudovulgare]GGQ07189.1 MerR family transcriptional regulator [Streptosporangium pseudovulgare]